MQLPLDDRPFRLRVGLRPLVAAEWLEIDEQYDAQVRLKRDLLEAKHAECVVHLPGTEAESSEVFDEIAAYLLAHHGGRFAAAPELPAGLHPIDAAGRLVQEDLCLHRVVDGEPILIAASVCFPTRWDVRTKLGKSVRAIHGPVPGYDEALGPAVDGAIARLAPGPGAHRFNWSIMASPELHQTRGHHRTLSPDIDPDDLWLRVERQTLRRLPRHDTILFTIRILQQEFRALKERPLEARRLAAALRTMPEEMASYKSLASLRERLISWLEVSAS